MGIAEKTSTMKGTILTALALLVASCQMKPTKHFLIETKTETGKGKDYQFNQGDINVSGSGHSNIGNQGWNAGGGATNQNLAGTQFGRPRNLGAFTHFFEQYYGNCLEEGEIVNMNFDMNWIKQNINKINIVAL